MVKVKLKTIKSSLKPGKLFPKANDTGEYGLAWVVLETANGNFKILNSGFFAHQGIKKIRDKYKEIQERQVTGTFGVPSTTLAKIRESVVHELRNKIHDLALRYNAKPIYEFQISNFESGSSRVSRIYRSVKVSDVYEENEADKSVVSSTWGDTAKQMGNHISAYATSQTCSKCRRSVLYDIEESKMYLGKKIDGCNGIYKISLGDLGECLIFLEKNNNASVNISGKEVRKAAYQFMRPPLDSQVVSYLGLEINPVFVNKRGNSALFVCPFCQHISDADIQAALQIAIRGFFRGTDIAKEEWYRKIQELDNFPVVMLDIGNRLIQK